jgi:hypothetical protein
MVVRKAEQHLNSRHAAERVERCWGGSTNKHVDEVKDKIKKLLIEYVDSGDKAEAMRCIKALNMPFFHHEVVKQVTGRASWVCNSYLECQSYPAHAAEGSSVSYVQNENLVPCIGSSESHRSMQI